MEKDRLPHKSRVLEKLPQQGEPLRKVRLLGAKDRLVGLKDRLLLGLKYRILRVENSLLGVKHSHKERQSFMRMFHT